MKYNISFIVALLLSTQVFFACHSAKPASTITSATEKTEQAIYPCEQIIKYVSKSGKETKSQAETFKSAEFIIDPTEMVITLNLESLANERGTIKANIVSIDCQLNTGLTAGYAIYRLLATAEGRDGKSLELSFKVEAKDDGLVIYYTNDTEGGEIIIVVDNWEVVK